jgi:hypothetical protein
MNDLSLKRFLLTLFVLVAVIMNHSCTPYSQVGKHVRTIDFSGFTWIVKESDEKRGPGPNYFGSSSDQVWVDELGNLHLKIKQVDGRWKCAEVYTKERFASGKFSFYLASKIDRLDPNVVLGLFTWHDNPLYHNQEIDIEISKWGRTADKNAQFVVQPYTNSKNLHRFDISLNGDFSTHEFTIGREFVFFESYHGHHEKSQTGGNIANWLYHSKKKTRVHNAQIHINLWLQKGLPPLNQNEAEIVIKKVEFVPIAELQS